MDHLIPDRDLQKMKNGYPNKCTGVPLKMGKVRALIFWPIQAPMDRRSSLRDAPKSIFSVLCDPRWIHGCTYKAEVAKNYVHELTRFSGMPACTYLDTHTSPFGSSGLVPPGNCHGTLDLVCDSRPFGSPGGPYN